MKYLSSESRGFNDSYGGIWKIRGAGVWNHNDGWDPVGGAASLTIGRKVHRYDESQKPSALKWFINLGPVIPLPAA